jgi:hypothetical protein
MAVDTNDARAAEGEKQRDRTRAASEFNQTWLRTILYKRSYHAGDTRPDVVSEERARRVAEPAERRQGPGAQSALPARRLISLKCETPER